MEDLTNALLIHHRQVKDRKMTAMMVIGNSKQHFAFSAYDRFNGWNKLIYKWIDGEKEHMDWERQYLNYIDKFGYDNFLMGMI